MSKSHKSIRERDDFFSSRGVENPQCSERKDHKREKVGTVGKMFHPVLFLTQF